MIYKKCPKCGRSDLYFGDENTRTFCCHWCVFQWTE